MLGWLFDALFGKADPDLADGFGQSVADGARFALRFRQCRAMRVNWLAPDDALEARIAAHPILKRFGDFATGSANVNGRDWIVRERAWFGWPDPDRFVFFALEGDALWAVGDFNTWPRCWTVPPEIQEPVS